MIKATQDGIKGSGFNFLTTPYLGPAKFVSLALEEINNTEDCAVFKFECLAVDVQGNNVKGLEHQHVEWNPEEDEVRLQKNIDRVGYIVSHLVPSEEILSVSAPNWTAYIKKMIELITQHKSTSREDISIKVMGNTYNKPKVNFPGYHAFIANKDSAPLTWSQSEIRENGKYLSGKGSEPTKMEKTGDLDHINDADF